MKKTKNKKIKKLGVGMAAVGTAAYMFLGPEGKKNRGAVKKIIQKVKKEVSKNKEIMKIVKAVKKKVKK